MEFIRREPLHQAWSSYSESQRNDVVRQLQGYMNELEQIQGTFIGSVDGQSVCNDHYFANRKVRAEYEQLCVFWPPPPRDIWTQAASFSAVPCGIVSYHPPLLHESQNTHDELVGLVGRYVSR